MTTRRIVAMAASSKGKAKNMLRYAFLLPGEYIDESVALYATAREALEAGQLAYANDVSDWEDGTGFVVQVIYALKHTATLQVEEH
jgi:hypothetical protein